MKSSFKKEFQVPEFQEKMSSEIPSLLDELLNQDEFLVTEEKADVLCPICGHYHPMTNDFFLD